MTAAPHTVVLVERDAERAAIEELVERAAGGSGGVLLFEGPAGVGKTRLLQHAVELAGDRPLTVLESRGGELEQSFPFGIARQLLEHPVAALDAAARATVLSGAAALAADLIDPRAPAVADAITSPEALYARLHGLYWVCAALAAGRPLLMVVDDAHWADEPSLEWLLFMTRRLADMSVTLMVGARPARAWPRPLALLAGQPHVARMRVQPLSEPAGRIVIEHLLGAAADEEFSRACHLATGGNPFLVAELIASVRAGELAPTAESAAKIGTLAPEGISRSLLARLAQLSPEAVALARAVAVLGAEAEMRHAAVLASVEGAAAAAAADELAAAGLLDAARPLRLVHPVLRTALYADLPAGARAELHARAAHVLAGEDGDLDAIAAHLLASEPAGAGATVERLVAAAARALSRGSPETAATYLRRALAEPPPPERRLVVLHRLGVVESRLGDAAAAEHVGEAVRLTRDPRDRAKLAFEASIGYSVGGRIDKAVRVLEEGLSEVGESDRELRWRLEAQLISLARLESAHADTAARHLAGIPRDLHGTTPGERLIVAELAWAALTSGEPVERVVELGLRAVGDGPLIAGQRGWSLSVLNGVWALALAEAHTAAGRAYDALIGAAQRAGSPIMFALLSSRRSQLHCLRGELPDAIADARASLDASGEFAPGLVAGLYGRLIDPLLEAGDIDGAREALAASGLGDTVPEGWQFFPLIQSRARLRIAEGSTEAGVDGMLTGQRVLARWRIANPAGAPCRSSAAVALARMGRREEAQELVTEELTAARRFGAPGTLGIALRAAGVVEGGATGIDLLREAVGQLERSPARLEHARALADLGAALRRSGRRRDAQPPLRQALDLAARCGGRVVAEHARAELVITGARPRRERIAGVQALTPSERRVAHLAARGLTNRQIAQALFVSQPTVVTHLGHCYQKLDISSRDQLGAALAET